MAKHLEDLQLIKNLYLQSIYMYAHLYDLFRIGSCNSTGITVRISYNFRHASFYEFYIYCICMNASLINVNKHISLNYKISI